MGRSGALREPAACATVGFIRAWPVGAIALLDIDQSFRPKGQCLIDQRAGVYYGPRRPMPGSLTARSRGSTPRDRPKRLISKPSSIASITPKTPKREI